MKIKVLLIDDDPNIHDAIRVLLRTDPDTLLIGSGTDGTDAVSLCGQLTPDIVLMDVVMPHMNGAEAVREVLHNFPDVKVLGLSSYRDYDDIKEMLNSGASGYVVKDALAQDLISAIQSTFHGNMVLSPQVAHTLLDPNSNISTSDFGLTDREIEVLASLAEGLTNAQIGYELGISASTVRFHINNILEKFEVSTRSEMLVMAAKNDLI